MLLQLLTKVYFGGAGHDWAKRWTAAFPGDSWKALLYSAYDGFTAQDERKFTDWMQTDLAVQ